MSSWGTKSKISSQAADYSRRLNLDKQAVQKVLESWVEAIVKSKDTLETNIT